MDDIDDDEIDEIDEGVDFTEEGLEGIDEHERVMDDIDDDEIDEIDEGVDFTEEGLEGIDEHERVMDDIDDDEIDEIDEGVDFTEEGLEGIDEHTQLADEVVNDLVNDSHLEDAINKVNLDRFLSNETFLEPGVERQENTDVGNPEISVSARSVPQSSGIPFDSNGIIEDRNTEEMMPQMEAFTPVQTNQASNELDVNNEDDGGSEGMLEQLYFSDPLDDFIFNRDREYRVAEITLKNSGKTKVDINAELRRLFPTVPDEIQTFSSMRSSRASSEEIELALVKKYPNLTPIIEEYKKISLMHRQIRTSLKDGKSAFDVEEIIRNMYSDVSERFIQSLPARIDSIQNEGSDDDSNSDDSDFDEDDDSLSDLLEDLSEDSGSDDNESIESEVLDALLDEKEAERE